MRAPAAVWSLAFTLSALSVAPAVADGERVAVTITDERISESSGLVQSTRDAALAYTVNDSGSAPVVYVIELATGDVVGTATLSQTDLVDAEALAIGADQRLYVADIGDNEGVRRRVDLYAIGQPERGNTTVPAMRHRLRYADGPRDAESLVSDTVDGSFYIVSKGLFGGELYRLGGLRPRGVTVARPVGDVAIPGLATDADVLPDRGGVVVRTYSDLYVFSVPGWEQLTSAPLPVQPQGETVAVVGGGPGVYVGSEGVPSDLLEIQVPTGAWRELDRRQEARQQDQEEAGRSDDGVLAQAGTPWMVAGGALFVLAGVIVLLTLRRRS